MNDLATQTMAHVKYLSADIGPRPAGSPENRAAASYIEDIFRCAGLAVERQPFNCAKWEHQDTTLELNGSKFEVFANWYSLPCDVTGPVIPVGSLELLEQADLAGSIVLLYGELTQYEISPRTSTAYYPLDHRKMNQLLDQKRPLAAITVCPLLQSIRHVIKDQVMMIPSATVMPAIGLELLNHAGEKVRLRIVSSRSAGQAWNIIGTRPGVRNERIVLCAHYDSVWGAPGAYDNASGVGVLLSVAQAMANRNLPVGLEFYASNGEEFGGQGTIAYLERYGLKEIPFRWDKPVGECSEVWKPILAVINADGVGQALGTNNYTVIAASKEFSNLVEDIRKKKYSGMIQVDPWPASDHYTFYSHGVPSIALGCTGGLFNHHHQPVDTLEWLSAEKLAEVAKFELDIIDSLADKPSTWCR